MQVGVDVADVAGDVAGDVAEVADMDVVPLDPGELLTNAAAARALGCSPAWARELAVRGTIRSWWTPLGRLFLRSDVEAFARARQAAMQAGQGREGE
jgi:hypothetical protein